MRDTFTVANIRCAGCVRNIRGTLLQVAGVTEVDVEIETGTVSVHGDGLDHLDLAARLAEQGYPEVGQGTEP